MLILSRKVGEAIRVSNDIVVEVIAIRGARVRLGVRAQSTSLCIVKK